MNDYFDEDQRGLATLLMVTLLAAVLAVAVLHLAGQRQLELRAQTMEALYLHQLFDAESAMARAVAGYRHGVDDLALVGGAGVEVAEMTATAHPDWPDDRWLELVSRSDSGGSGPQVSEQLWSRPLLKQLPDRALTLRASPAPLGVELAARSSGGGPAVGAAITSLEPLTLAPSASRCEASRLLEGLCTLVSGGSRELPLDSGSVLGPELVDGLLGVPLPLLTASPQGFVDGGVGRAESSCGSQLEAAPVALWWRGDCSLADRDYGSPSAPKLLVIEDGNLTLASGGSRLFGILLLVGEHDHSVLLHWPAPSVVAGAVVSDRPLEVSGGPLRVVFDRALMVRLQARQRVVEELPGSWRDW